MSGGRGCCDGDNATTSPSLARRAQNGFSLSFFMVGILRSAIEVNSVSEIIPTEVLCQEDKKGSIRVLVGFPHEGMTPSETYCNRLANLKHLGHLEERGKILKESPRFEFFMKTCGRMHVHVAREEMAKTALEMNADYLFMIDDDMLAPDDLFEKLYASHKDIVAPLAFTRNFPHKPVMYSCIEGWDPVIQREHFTNFAVMNYPKDKLVQCDAVGFGAVLINMRVIRGMEAPYFMNPDKTGEDINFCYQAKKHGFFTWMDTRVKLGHLSHPIIVTEEYVLSQWKAYGMEVDKRFGKIEKKYAGNGDDSKEPVLTLGD